MEFAAKIDLSRYSALACPSEAEYLAVCHSLEDLREAFVYARQHTLPVNVLGGGSNVILPERLPGLVILNRLPGVRFQTQDPDTVLVEAGAGEIWDGLVRQSVGLGLRGIENLILIPGRVGAAPIQNIGAYGVELSDSLQSVHVYDAEQDQAFLLSRQDCKLAYRDSIFKTRAGRHWVVTGLTLCLSRQRPFTLEYADLKQRWMHEEGGREHPEAVAQVIERLRRAKLPDPAEIPNAGSFFKNPVVDSVAFQALKARFPDLVAYPVSAQSSEGAGMQTDRVSAWKLAAGWLIDKAGWKGRTTGGLGCHALQALVLINPGRRPASELLSFARQIQADVYDRFGVALEPEPVLLGAEWT